MKITICDLGLLFFCSKKYPRVIKAAMNLLSKRFIAALEIGQIGRCIYPGFGSQDTRAPIDTEQIAGSE
jgi:hypothetical protein